MSAAIAIRAGQVSLAAALAASIAMPAAAQSSPASLVERTCVDSPTGRHAVDRRRLATFILSDAGVIVDNPEDWLRTARAIQTDRSRALTPQERQAIESVARMQQRLGSASGESADRFGLAASPAGADRIGFWLFGDNVTLECIKAEPEEPGVANGNLDLRLRRTPEELNIVKEEDRRTAGSALLSYQRERTRLDNGTTRHDTTLAFEGALGLVIDQGRWGSALLFASYDLQRVRSTPPPTLPPGTSQRDKDTDVLELGLTGSRLFSRQTTGVPSFSLTFNGSVILDRVDHSERARFAITLNPGFSADLGLCRMGSYRQLGLGLGGRCSLIFRAQLNHFLDRGTGTAAANDEFMLAGGEAGIEFAPMTDGILRDSGVIAGASYRYEASVGGNTPDIDRFSAFLKYRHWVNDYQYAIDVGFNFVDGTNPQSFADEHRISFGLGLIF